MARKISLNCMVLNIGVVELRGEQVLNFQMFFCTIKLLRSKPTSIALFLIVFPSQNNIHGTIPVVT